ncbi:hypothetical protein CFL01nite_23340 [Corynebacterium flavescens]|uniref:Glyceraldehyde 3-phosphate dehydrogenase NAD(P) binding domain-containing protein n=1 Tax=Corynebacterium flavescens TaxID=28028 RepID=A0A1L7CJ15_CORFL|nr:hypothetical protein CFLV_00565 [Corynebacterium flavescens]GEB98839.1 hypothetical protein CFL01nite_23340 [Corynebacterium flavescens]
MPNKIKVAVNGYGVIGKRVADAVRAQEDMELLGASDVTTAITQGISVAALPPNFATAPSQCSYMRSGIWCTGESPTGKTWRKTGGAGCGDCVVRRSASPSRRQQY